MSNPATLKFPMQRLRKAVSLRRWLHYGWMMPCSLAALSGFSGQEAAAQTMTMYSAAFCNPFCLTEGKDSDSQAKVTFSGLPSFFSTNGGNFIDQNFKGSFAINPDGSPLKKVPLLHCNILPVLTMIPLMASLPTDPIFFCVV